MEKPTFNFGIDIKPDSKLDLSKKKLKVLQFLFYGFSNKKIAEILGVKEVTIKMHLTELFKKFGVKNRAQLIRSMSDFELSCYKATVDDKMEELEQKIEELEQQNAFECGCVSERDEIIKELKEELQQRIDDNANLYSNLCNALMRLQEADSILYDFICHPYPHPITYKMREKLEKYSKKYEISLKSS